MNTLTTKRGVAALLAAVLLLPVFAFAQTGVNVQTSVTGEANAGGVRVRAAIVASTTAETTRASRAKDKAAQEIDRRIAALERLVLRVAAMKKVSAEFKASLDSNANVQIENFEALKSKIEADTDIATLRADVKTITDSYRIFLLVIPQGHISAAADRMATIINMMLANGTKLQARVNAAAQAGADTASLTEELNDLVLNLESARTHAQLAIDLVGPLAPDNGDTSTAASNAATLKKANEEIKAGRTDLIAARKNIDTVIKGLRSISAAASASASAETE